MNESLKREIEHESRVAALELWYEKERDKLRRAGAVLWETRASEADKILKGQE